MTTTFDFAPIWRQIDALHAIIPDLAHTLAAGIPPDWERHCDPSSVEECRTIRQRVLRAKAPKAQASMDSMFRIWAAGDRVYAQAYTPVMTNHPRYDYVFDAWELTTREVHSTGEAVRFISVPMETDGMYKFSHEAVVSRPSPSPARLAELRQKAEAFFHTRR